MIRYKGLSITQSFGLYLEVTVQPINSTKDHHLNVVEVILGKPPTQNLIIDYVSTRIPVFFISNLPPFVQTLITSQDHGEHGLQPCL